MGVSLGITDIYDPSRGSGRGGHRDRVGTLKCSYQGQSLPRNGRGGDGTVCHKSSGRNSFKHQDQDRCMNLSLPTVTWCVAGCGGKSQTRKKNSILPHRCRGNISKSQEKRAVFYLTEKLNNFVSVPAFKCF